MTHALKTWPEYYKLVVSGKKKFEIRKLDRPYKAGDYVLLQEFDPKTNTYTGMESEFIISLIVEGFGIKKGYGVFQLEDKPDNH